MKMFRYKGLQQPDFQVQNHEETMEFLKLKPDRLGHGTCIHPSLGGDENLWTQIISEPVPVEVGSRL